MKNEKLIINDDIKMLCFALCLYESKFLLAFNWSSFKSEHEILLFLGFLNSDISRGLYKYLRFILLQTRATLESVAIIRRRSHHSKVCISITE